MKYDMIKIRTSGEIELIPVESAITTFYDLRKHIDGYIEIVNTTSPEFVLVIDEEGKLKGLEFNPIASMLARLGVGDWIAGDALLLIRSGCDLKAIPETRARNLIRIRKESDEIDKEAERSFNEYEAEYGADGRIAQKRGKGAW